ncbi:hypothetical protein MXD63_33015 [Frankia sp. Cpl3]|nr:hypothetical protein [Frankia sp. Cpl3]
MAAVGQAASGARETSPAWVRTTRPAGTPMTRPQAVAPVVAVAAGTSVAVVPREAVGSRLVAAEQVPVEAEEAPSSLPR